MKGLACLVKEEFLSLCEECTKGMVLISKSPFGSYYSEQPEVQKTPEVLYIAVKPFNECLENKMVLLRQAMKKHGKNLIMNYAHLNLFNKPTPVIVYHAEDVSEGNFILEKLSENGIDIIKRQNVAPYTSRVQIRKFVNLKKIQKGVFKSDERFLYYLAVPYKLEWENFRDCINLIRNSHNFPHFDAAQLSLFKYDKAKEFVRIYSQTASKDDLTKMRSEILKLYSKYE